MARAHGIHLTTPLTGGSLALVMAGTGPDGAPLVCKVSSVRDVARVEALALRCWAGGDAPRLHGTPRGVLIMDQCPGTPPTPAPTADEALGALARRLHVPRPPGVPTLAARVALSLVWSCARVAHEGTHPWMPWLDRLVTAARTAPGTHMIHGDFQAKNLLVHDGHYTAFDPIACAGPLGYDLATWALTTPDPPSSVARAAAGADVPLSEGERWVTLLAPLFALGQPPDSAARARLMDLARA